MSTGTRKGPAIVVSGHDLLDLEELLEQTHGTGVNVYTHGEMLPAHGYPGLRKFSHLAGHFGTAWQNQQKEFDGQPAAFLFTTNCIQKPRESYKDRVFTTGLVAFPGVPHAENRDFSGGHRAGKGPGRVRGDKGTCPDHGIRTQCRALRCGQGGGCRQERSHQEVPPCRRL